MEPITQNLGYPRIGAKRELKKATESFWKGEISDDELLREASKIRRENWLLQKEIGIDLIPCNDFSFYDQMLDMSVLLGVVPSRFSWNGQTAVDLATYFAMARGSSVTALEMTKWFDTNYHYLVPELAGNQTFKIASNKPFDEFREALALGIKTKPVFIGPLTFLLLAKNPFLSSRSNNLALLDSLISVYAGILKHLHELGASWIQLDEPVLVMDLDKRALDDFKKAYQALRKALPKLKIMLATYFGGIGNNLDTVLKLPVDALHVDLVRAPEQIEAVLKEMPESLTLSAGIVDGRNIWKNNFANSLALLEKIKAKISLDRLMIAPSCSLLHSPVSLANERKLDKELTSWLAFAGEKLREVKVLAAALSNKAQVSQELEENAQAQASRNKSPRIHIKQVKERLAAVAEKDLKRLSPYAQRSKEQHKKFKLPIFPTTTIGSFPQTEEVRTQRALHKKGTISDSQYYDFVRSEIERVIRLQEQANIDVLVHGEFERNDMVEYFAEYLAGFAFTEHGWVQSYGTRYVKPPVIYGDVHRPKPMTVEWSQYAKSLATKPVKGMLTGPVTILQWSFVRDDQPRWQTCKQIAAAIRDEVKDLESAGVSIIQIDEPALREGLPLRAAEQAAYLKWAVDCFCLATSCVRDETQIHTHMCYCEFNEIIDAIAALDADVISIEASRSKMELLESFKHFKYPNEVGPGIWDIHSPRVPSCEEIIGLLEKAATVLSYEQIWVNPDCGLKTRSWDEVIPSLTNMVAAAVEMRKRAERLVGQKK